jgi:hypothetical protein
MPGARALALALSLNGAHGANRHKSSKCSRVLYS